MPITEQTIRELIVILILSGSTAEMSKFLTFAFEPNKIFSFYLPLIAKFVYYLEASPLEKKGFIESQKQIEYVIFNQMLRFEELETIKEIISVINQHDNQESFEFAIQHLRNKYKKDIDSIHELQQHVDTTAMQLKNKNKTYKGFVPIKTGQTKDMSSIIEIKTKFLEESFSNKDSMINEYLLELKQMITDKYNDLNGYTTKEELYADLRRQANDNEKQHKLNWAQNYSFYFSPLGGCLNCFHTWISIITFTVIYFFLFNIPAWYFFPYLFTSFFFLRLR